MVTTLTISFCELAGFWDVHHRGAESTEKEEEKNKLHHEGTKGTKKERSLTQEMSCGGLEARADVATKDPSGVNDSELRLFHRGDAESAEGKRKVTRR